jgi:hypothetical protein
MAVAVGWKEYVDTDLNFSEFFTGNHTLVLRFMPSSRTRTKAPPLRKMARAPSE